MNTSWIGIEPEEEERLIECSRYMTVSEKARIWAMLTEVAEIYAIADVRRRYPDADEWECKLRAASRRIPAKVMREAFGWDPEAKGK